jgi:hypothetical protein
MVNEFYTGMIRIRRTEEVFAGNHQPLVAKSLFDRVQSGLQGSLFSEGRSEGRKQ